MSQIHSTPANQFFQHKTKALLATAAIAAVTAIALGLMVHFQMIRGIHPTVQFCLLGTGICLATGFIAGTISLFRKRKNTVERTPKGFLKSPYSLGASFRFAINHVTNGFFSFIHPEHKNMKLLEKEGEISICSSPHLSTKSIKILFLGDIMVSKSGNPPLLDEGMSALLKSAEVIVANVEAPVVPAKQTKRGLSLKFEMSASYLQSIYEQNPNAQWVFSLANNHACDTSEKSEEDCSGIVTTIQSIKSIMPHAAIIGADIEEAKPVFTMEAEGGNIGFVAWTELMNNDRKHYKKKIIRDVDPAWIRTLKSQHTLLFGFPHGNEEQSYYPLEETRAGWSQLVGERGFDAIVGHGPHVIHPAEWMNGRLLFHSIGNFCSPVGKSQTRVGCIPEMTIVYEPDTVSLRYKVHLLEQRGEKVHLLADANETIYPKMLKRLQNIWGSLFSS